MATSAAVCRSSFISPPPSARPAGQRSESASSARRTFDLFAFPFTDWAARCSALIRRARLGQPELALAAAAELDFVSLPDALEIVLLLVDDHKRFRRAALRWHPRYCGEVTDVGFEEAHAVLACLAGIAGATTEAGGSCPGRARAPARARAGE